MISQYESSIQRGIEKKTNLEAIERKQNPDNRILEERDKKFIKLTEINKQIESNKEELKQIFSNSSLPAGLEINEDEFGVITHEPLNVASIGSGDNIYYYCYGTIEKGLETKCVTFELWDDKYVLLADTIVYEINPIYDKDLKIIQYTHYENDYDIVCFPVTIHPLLIIQLHPIALCCYLMDLKLRYIHNHVYKVM